MTKMKIVQMMKLLVLSLLRLKNKTNKLNLKKKPVVLFRITSRKIIIKTKLLRVI